MQALPVLGVVMTKQQDVREACKRRGVLVCKEGIDA